MYLLALGSVETTVWSLLFTSNTWVCCAGLMKIECQVVLWKWWTVLHQYQFAGLAYKKWQSCDASWQFCQKILYHVSPIVSLICSVFFKKSIDSHWVPIYLFNIPELPPGLQPDMLRVVGPWQKDYTMPGCRVAVDDRGVSTFCPRVDFLPSKHKGWGRHGFLFLL